MHNFKKNVFVKAGEITQGLQVLAVLTDNLGSVPATKQQLTVICNSGHPREPGVCMVHRYTRRHIFMLIK